MLATGNFLSKMVGISVLETWILHTGKQHIKLKHTSIYYGTNWLQYMVNACCV